MLNERPTFAWRPVALANQEEGRPIFVCRGPLRPWGELWGELRHLD